VAHFVNLCSLYYREKCTGFSHIYIFFHFLCVCVVGLVQFCIHGPFCRYKHIRRPREDLPAVADFTLGLSQMQANKDHQSSSGGGGSGPGGGDRRGGEQNQTKRPAPKPNEFYKISLCKHFLQGDCPFGEGCHFAHGEHELRTFPRGSNNRGDDDNDNDGDDGEGDYGDHNNHRLSDNMFSNHHHEQQNNAPTVDYYTGGASGGGRPTPIVEPEQAHFFIIRAATLNDLV
jgi:Zinc finger C-x8-C-x5-C-x3-H type (and similar)